MHSKIMSLIMTKIILRKRLLPQVKLLIQLILLSIIITIKQFKVRKFLINNIKNKVMLRPLTLTKFHKFPIITLKRTHANSELI